MAIEVRLGFAPESLERLEALKPGMAIHAANIAIRMWTVDMVRSLKSIRSIGFKNRTGNYRRGWLGQVIGQGEGVIFVNLANYSRYIEEGTRPHLIAPRFKQILRWRKGGKSPISAFKVATAGNAKNFHWSMLVHHPGTAPQWVFRDTFRANRGKVFTFLRAELNRAFGATNG